MKAFLFLLGLLSSTLHAQEFPHKGPLEITVLFPAGTSADVTARMLADGMSNADVAQKLFISQETVKSHVRHILTKLEADTRTHAVAIALREAIID